MNGPTRSLLYVQSHVATGCKQLASEPHLVAVSFPHGTFISREIVCLITEEPGL